MHTPLPWNEHHSYSANKVFTVPREDGTSFEALDLSLASGDKLIGNITMANPARGWPCVNDEQEARDNLALIIKAVNSHDQLANACKVGLTYLDAICLNSDNPKKVKNYADAARILREALAKAGKL